ncbi:hypothetical protein OY671_009164, partial [Metschnikowia pulcherrima]
SSRAPKRRTEAQFGWSDGWTLEVDPATDQPRGMTITSSNWVYEGIVSERSSLTMHPDYFSSTGGLERALYRIARKHAGQQRGGWTCRVEILREKAGSDAQPKEFNRMLRKVIEADQLPEYTMASTKTAEDAPAVSVHCRVSDPVERVKSRDQIREKVRSITGMNCVVELVPPRTSPRTSSGKLSRAKAKKLYSAGEIEPYRSAA